MVLRLHSLKDDFPELQHVKGIESYWERALIEGGYVLGHGKSDEDLDLLLCDYKAWGWEGQIYWVQNRGSGSFYNDILKDPSTREFITSFVCKNGHQLELYSQSLQGKKLVENLGLDWNYHVKSPKFKLSVFWNNKGFFRKRLSQKGFAHFFPPGYTAYTKSELFDQVEHLFFSGYQTIIIKPPNLASSEGIVMLRKNDNLKKSIDSFWFKGTSSVVEAAFDHWPISCVFSLKEEGAIPLYTSLQCMQGVSFDEKITLELMIKKGVPAHRGNIISTTEEDLGPFSKEAQASYLRSCKEIVSVLWNDGLRGDVCFDGIHLTPMISQIIEANVRKSSSMYGWAFLQTIKKQFPEERCVLIMCNIALHNASNYRKVRDFLSDILYKGDGKAGVNIFHIHCLPQKKAGILAVGKNYSEALEIFWTAVRLINPV